VVLRRPARARVHRLRRVALAVAVCGAAAALLVGGAQSRSLTTHVFTVDTTADSVDNVTGDGTCADSGGQCSLRAAVEEANAVGGSSVISLPAGTYTLSLGELAFTADISLSGAGARTTSIIQGGVQRVIEISTGSSVISGVTIQGGDTLANSGETNEGVGGGIWIDSPGSLTVTRSTITHNVASSSGGGIDNNGTLVVDHSTIEFNGAGTIGGGIDDFGALVSIGDSTISANSAGTEGGGILAANTTTLTNDTFGDNQVTTPGGPAGDVFVYGSADVIAINTIFGSSSTSSDCNASLDSHGGNLASDASCGLVAVGDVQGVDPQLGALANNGGTTDTYLPGVASPALDAGLDGLCPADDQRGTARPQGSHCDIGAVEVAVAAPPVSAAQSTVSASPTSVAADGITTSTITVTLKDSGGAAVSGKTVTLSAGSGSSTIATVGGTTNGSGVATFTVKDAAAETVTYTAHDTTDSVDVTQTAAVTFTAAAPPPTVSAAQSTVSATPTSVAADGSTPSTISVSLKDSGGAAVSGKTVTLTAAAGSSTISPVSGTTNGSGVASFTVKDGTAETVTYTAHDTTDSVDVMHTATVTFTVTSSGGSTSGGGTPTQAGASPPTVTISGDSTTSVGHNVGFAGGAADPNGVAIVSYVWSFGDGGSATGPTATHRYTTAGTYAVTLSATDTLGKTGTATHAIVVSPAQLSAEITYSPAPAVAGVGDSLHVGLSPGGNSVHSATWSFPGGGSASGATVQHTFAKAGTYAVTVTATAASGAIATTEKDIVVAPTALGPVSTSKSAISAPGAATIGATPIHVIVALRDAYGRAIAGKTVQLAASGHAAFPQAGHDTLTTNTGGDAIFSVYDTHAENVTFTAADTTDNRTLAGSATTTFAAAASATRSTVTVSPAQLPADGTSTATVTVTLKDSSGHLLPGKTVHVIPGPGPGTTAPLHVEESQTDAPVTNANGVATFTFTDTSPETIAVRPTDATDGVPLSFVDIRFQATAGGPASATTSTLVAGPSMVAAGGTSTGTVTATLRNAAGGPVPGASVTLHAASGVSRIATPTATTDTNGKATFTVSDPKPQSVVYSATDTSEGIAVSQTAQVTFYRPGPSATTSTTAASPANVPSDGASATTITVTLLDAGGNPVPGMRLQLRKSSTTATVSPSTTTTNRNGVATFTSTDTATESVTYTPQLESSTVALPTATVGFADMDVTAETTRVVGTTPEKWEVLVHLYQGSTSVRGKHIDLVPPAGSNVTVTAERTDSSTNAGVTDATGRAEFLVRAQHDGTVVLDVRDQTDSVLFPGAVSLAFSDSPSAAHSTVTISPLSVVADGQSAATVTATLDDASGTPVVGQAVDLKLSSASTKAPSAHVSGVSTVTDDTGTVVFHVRDATAEAVGVRAYAQLSQTSELVLGPAQTVTFVTASNTATSATQSTIAADALVPADGTTTGNVTVTLKNGGGGAVAGEVVTLHASGGSSAIAPPSATTDGSGVARFTVKDATTESLTYTATDTTDGVALAGTAHVEFYDAGAPSASTSTVVASPLGVAGDGATPATVTVTLHNVGGGPIAGTQVALTSNGTNADISPAVAVTDATGVATFTATDAASEIVTFTAADTLLPSLDLPQTTVTFGAPQPPVVSFSFGPTSPKAGQQLHFISTATDPSGVAITSYAWDFGDGVTGSGTSPFHGYAQPGTYVVALHITDARGATATVSETVTVASAVLTVSAPTYAGVGETGGATLTIAVPGSTHATDSVTVSAGSAVSATGYELTTPTHWHVFPITTALSNGTVTVPVRDSVPETVVFQVSDSRANAVADVAITFVPTASSAASSLSLSPRTVPADDHSAATVTVRLFDANGNPAANNSVLLRFSGTGAYAGLGTGAVATPDTAVTNAQGVATFTVRDATPASMTVSAIDLTNGESIASASSNENALTFTQTLKPSPSNSKVVAAAASVTTLAPGTTVSVRLINKGGGSVPNKTVSLQGKTGHATVTPAQAVTDARGIATFTVVDGTAETVTFAARDVTDALALTQQPSVKFADHVVDKDASLIYSSGSAPAGADNPVTITVVLYDAINKPVQGRTVHLHASSPRSTVTPASVVSNQFGEAVFQVNDPKMETVTYTATAELGSGTLVTLTKRAAVTYTTPVPSTTKSTIDPLSQSAEFWTSPTITVTLRDGAGDALAGRTVRLTFVYQDTGIYASFDYPDSLVTVDPNRGTVIDAGGFQVNTGTATTDANGVAVFTVFANNEAHASGCHNIDVQAIDADGTTYDLRTVSVCLVD